MEDRDPDREPSSSKTSVSREKWPNFFIVGAPRCGTTAFYSYLRRHPDIYLPPSSKEPHFFAPDLDSGSEIDGRFFTRTIQEYRDLFEDADEFGGADETTRVGEASTLYLYSSVAARRIREACRDCKIIIMVRDPVELMYSFHSHRLRRGHETIPSFEEALEAEPEGKEGRRIPKVTMIPKALLYREVATLSPQIERYLEVFDREDIHFVVYDDLADDTASVFRDVLEFLDVDPHFQTDFRRIAPNRVARSKWLAEMRRKPLVLSLGRLVLPQFLRRRLVTANYAVKPRPTMDPRLRRRLQEEFSPEVRRLSDILGRDLTGWTRSQG